MTEEELTKLDEARAREAAAQYFEQTERHDFAKKMRAGKLEPYTLGMTTIAARLAREGWMPPVDPRLEAAREIMARAWELQGSHIWASLWRDPSDDTPNDKAALEWLASCLPEGYSVSDLKEVGK